MKKIAVFFFVVLMVAGVSGYAFSHCGTCGVEKGYVCAKCNVAAAEPGKCSTCGNDMVQGDVKKEPSYKCMVCGVTNDTSGKCKVEGTEVIKMIKLVPAPNAAAPAAAEAEGQAPAPAVKSE